MTESKSAKRHPRLLVATEFPPNASGGGPAVVRQMLKGWPTDRIYWWSCLEQRDQRFGQKVAGHHVAKIPRRLYPEQRWARQKSWLLENVWNHWAARHFRATLSSVKPDVVWVIPHFWSILPLAQALSKAVVPFHVSLHDYPDSLRSVARVGPRRAAGLAAMADRLYANAGTRDAICAPMVADLRQRTAADGNVCRAGLEPGDFDYLVRRCTPTLEEIRIAYAGTIIVEAEFAAFVASLNRVRSSLAKPILLEITGAHSYVGRSWFDCSWMKELGNLAEPALSEALRRCTWGFAPMGLEDDDPRYNRFSLPTKLISYLANGLPVITLGHPSSSLVKIAQAYAIGTCVTGLEVRELDEALRHALVHHDPWARFGGEIQRCARTEFDATRMRNLLHECWFRIGERRP